MREDMFLSETKVMAFSGLPIFSARKTPDFELRIKSSSLVPSFHVRCPFSRMSAGVREKTESTESPKLVSSMTWIMHGTVIFGGEENYERKNDHPETPDGHPFFRHIVFFCDKFSDGKENDDAENRNPIKSKNRTRVIFVRTKKVELQIKNSLEHGTEASSGKDPWQ